MTPTPNSIPLLLLCILSFSMLFPVILIASAIRIVPENIRLSVFRFGRYIGDRGPGIVFLMPFGIDRAIRLDVNDQLQHAQAMQQMWGVIGETQTPVHLDGQVNVSGQVWNAVSHEPLPANTKIRVVRVLLEVEKLA